MSLQKLLTFLYTNNEKSEREIKESIPFTISAKIIKKSSNKSTKGDKKTVYRKL